MRKRRLLVTLLAAAMTAVCPCASSQHYPAKPVRIVTMEGGGSVDLAARLLAQGLSSHLGQGVVVDNRGGGGGLIAAATVKNASADGYTLLFQGSAFWTLPLLQNVPYDPLKDFTPVVMAVQVPLVMLVNPSLGANSVKDLIAIARARPGELNFGQSTGSGAHLAAELFKSMAAINIVHIPYKGGAPAVLDLTAGRIQLVFAAASTAMTQTKSGKLRALAVTGAAPSALLPGVPPVSATVPGYEAALVQGLFAPARVSRAIIDRLNAASVKALNGQDIRDKFLVSGAEVVASSPQQFATTVKLEMARLGKVIREAGIAAE